jgi:serine/threonine-protein kinase
MRITLTVTAGPHKGQVFTFAGHDTFLVGRSKRAHFRLPMKDKYFSRIHFMVEVNPPKCRLMDMGSTNGTLVNGTAVPTADLKNGDRIQAGRTVLRVAVEDGETPATATSQAPALQAAASSAEVESVPVLEMVTQERPAAAGQAETSTYSPAPRAQDTRPSLPPSSVRERCLACLAALPAGSGKGGVPASAGPALCAACQNLAAQQAQPITGYQIIREIGRGGMGVVYLAIRSADNSLNALKTVTPAVAGSEAQVDRFLREAKILRDLNHPHIVAFREMGEANGQLYFGMDYVRGTDAAHLVKTHGPLPVPRAVGLVCQLLEALEYAHARGFVHRDIKPANLLVAEEEGRDVAKLADFGLARVYQTSQLSGLTMTGDVGGTTAYMAPEQITHYREAKPAADQYAAGATVYNLLTNKFIFDPPRNFQQQLLMVLQEEPVPILSRREDVPDALAVIIHKAIAKKPDERFPDVQALRKALLKFCR